MKRQVIRSLQAPQGWGSQAISVEAQRTTRIGAQLPVDLATGAMVEGGAGPQARQVLDNVAAVLESAGLDWDNVVELHLWVARYDDLPAVDEALSARFLHREPVRSVVQAVLPQGALVQLACVAVS